MSMVNWRERQTFNIYIFNLSVKHFALFHTSRTIVKDKQTTASPEKYRPSKGGNASNQNWRGKKNKYDQTDV